MFFIFRGSTFFHRTPPRISHVTDSFCYDRDMKLYVARHGRSNYNDLELFNSDPAVDVHLTELGIEQAEALSDKLKNIKIDHIFVSELKRTQQTAAIVNKYHNAAISIDAKLNDHRSGFEDRPYAEYDALFDASDDSWNARFNDGESLEDTRVRIREFLENLKSKNYESVLVVTSMTIVQAFYGVLTELASEDTWNITVDTGSYTEFDL